MAEKKKKNATRTILLIIGALVVLLVIVGIVARLVFGGGDKATEVEVAEVGTRDITQVVTASGKVQPEVEVKISPDVSGEIVDLRIKEGDDVRRGDLLLRIDPDFYDAQVEQAKALVLQAMATEAQRRADMLNADLEMKRQEALFNSDAISESDYQRAKTAFDISAAGLEAAQYSVQSSEARLKEAQEQLAKTVVYAPMSGTVSKLDVELGERVVGTSQFAGTEMLRIAQLSQMELEVDVNENDVVNVAAGDTASIEVDAYPERFFRGMVTEIANSARVTGAGTQEQVTNFPVKIRLLDPHNLAASGAAPPISASETDVAAPAPNFRPGMSGTVDIFTRTVEDVIAVPIQAVTIRDLNQVKRDSLRRERRGREDAEADSIDWDALEEEDLQKVIFLIEDEKASMVRVETGISDDTHIQITSGLEGGEKAIVGPYRAVSRTLGPGDPVTEKRSRPGRPGTTSQDES
jgi:HlyD family secretion protein